MNYTLRPLTTPQLRVLAPSAFAEHSSANTSDRYAYIPTHRVIDGLIGEGWVPVKAMQSISRLEERQGYARHMIRFQHPDSAPAVVGDVFPEIILSNAHDGSSAYRMDAGLFRLACSNGMCVSDTAFEKISIPHRGNVQEKVIEASYEIMKEVPRLSHEVELFRATAVTPLYASALAAAAIELKYPSVIDIETGKPVRTAPVQNEDLLRVRRREDREQSNNLWGVFNTIQENILQGGLRGRSASGRRVSTRPVKSVTEDLRLNKALWTLATEMRKLLIGE